MRLLLALFGGLLAAVVVAVCSLPLFGDLAVLGRDLQALRASEQIREKALAEHVERAHAQARRELDNLCAYDVRVERLALELDAGSAAQDSAHVAQSLRRATGGALWIFVERRGALALLGASDRASPLPSAAELEQATRRKQPQSSSAQRDMLACSRNLQHGKLWLLTALAHEARPDAKQGQADNAVDAAPAHASWALLAAACVAFGLGSALVWFVMKPRAEADAVLTEIERAAERVAQGDLSSQIGLRVGGRADQTFQTFDRMTKELRETRQKLVDAERAAAWQDMARRIAHEIKNPLSPIQMAIETLRKAHQKRLPAFDEIFEESTRAILEEVRRMEHIVREFSEFARLPKPRPGALELSALVEDTVGLYRPSDVEVSVRVAPELPSVRADREQITQVIVNLLQNAADAAREVAAPRVELSIVLHPAGIALHVDDNGPGIPTADRERVFEPYVTTKAHGTGLGLAIVRRIVLDHGGSVGVSESPLGGARFSLVLPNHDADRTARA